MSSVVFLKELRRRWPLVLVAIVVAALVALPIAYQVSVFPPSLTERSKVEAEGQVQVLVDSSNSPIANAHRDLSGLVARAGVFARVMSGGNVIHRAAVSAGIPFREVQVAGPVPLPGEAPGVSEGPEKELPYQVEITQQTELPILTIVTRAPTVAAAQALATAVPEAMSLRVHSIQRHQDTPEGRRVEFRVLGPAQAGLIDNSAGKKIALGVFVFLLVVFLTLIVGLPRFMAAWRAAEIEPKAKRAKRSRRLPKLKSVRPKTAWMRPKKNDEKDETKGPKAPEKKPKEPEEKPKQPIRG